MVQIPIWKRLISELTTRMRSKRKESFDVLHRMKRKKLSLSKASGEVGIDRKTVIRHVGRGLVKKGKRWIPTGKDPVSRNLRIYEYGEEKIIAVPDSYIASKIGKYHSIIKRFLESGNESILNEALNLKYVRDEHGKTHELELRPDVLYQLVQKRAEPEFFQIYHE